jgi:hypothetical protein
MAGQDWEEHFRDTMVYATKARYGLGGTLAQAKAMCLHWLAFHQVGAPDQSYSSPNHHALLAAAVGASGVTGHGSWSYDPWDYARRYIQREEAGLIEVGPTCYGDWNLGGLVGIERLGASDVQTGARGILGCVVADWGMGAVDFKPAKVTCETGPQGAVKVNDRLVPPEPVAPASIRIGNRGVFPPGSLGWAAEMVLDQVMHLVLGITPRDCTDRALDIAPDPAGDGAWPVGYVLLAHRKPVTRQGYRSAEIDPATFGMTPGQRDLLRTPWTDAGIAACVALSRNSKAYPKSGKTWLRVSPTKVAAILGADLNSTKPALMMMWSEPAAGWSVGVSPVPFQSQHHVRSESDRDGRVVEFSTTSGDVLRTITLPPEYGDAAVYEWDTKAGITGAGDPPPPEVHVSKTLAAEAALLIARSVNDKPAEVKASILAGSRAKPRRAPLVKARQKLDDAIEALED